MKESIYIMIDLIGFSKVGNDISPTVRLVVANVANVSIRVVLEGDNIRVIEEYYVLSRYF